MKKQIYLDRSQFPQEALDTQVLQNALDQCRNWGGEIILSSGIWRISGIHLYSDTTLRLKSGCQLMGSTNFEDYGDSPKAMITAENADNIAIIGELGTTINGQDCRNPFSEEESGPMGMIFSRCHQITLRGYTFTRCGSNAHVLESCEDALMDDIRILGGYTGAQFDHSKNIRIENCDFRTGDNCLEGFDDENILVRQTYLNSPCSCFRMGARNLLVESCRFWGPGEYRHSRSWRCSTMYAFQYYSPGSEPCPPSSHWVIEDCVFEDMDALFHLKHGSCLEQGSPLKDITLENCTMTGILTGSEICSTVPMDVNLCHIRMKFKNGLPENGLCETCPQVTFHIRDVQVQSL